MTELSFGSLFKKPEWIMWGIDNEDDTITLIATRELEDWMLVLNYEQEFIGTQEFNIFYNRPNIESHGKTKHFAIITANSYGEAIAQLQERWSNENKT